MLSEIQLIAPCGMNCAPCKAHLRTRQPCPGCHREYTHKSVTKVVCLIKNCPTIKQNQSGFCFECAKYPCKSLKHLDKRYRTKYSMSMIENLEFIREKGLNAFVEKEKERWRCKNCGGVICVHTGRCHQCGERPDDIQPLPQVPG